MLLLLWKALPALLLCPQLLTEHGVIRHCRKDMRPAQAHFGKGLFVG
jgi:hypothetical protein